jgi:hypothetical protein
MSQDSSTLHSSRRSTAVGIWSLLVVLLALTTTDVSTLFAIVILLFVSVSSSIALFLAGRDRHAEKTSASQQQSDPIAVALAVPVGWAVMFGLQNDAFLTATFIGISVVPVIALWLSLIPRKASFNTAPNLVPMSVEPSPIASSHTADELDMNDDDEIDEIDDEEQLQLSTEEPSFADDIADSSNVTQWLTRSLTVDGEIIEGGVRIDFAEGQRDATVHVSFCPPFRYLPEVTTEDLDGADLEIRVAATFPFGARLTVRRPGASKNQASQTLEKAYRVGFVAIAKPARRAA